MASCKEGDLICWSDWGQNWFPSANYCLQPHVWIYWLLWESSGKFYNSIMTMKWKENNFFVQAVRFKNVFQLCGSLIVNEGVLYIYFRPQQKLFSALGAQQQCQHRQEYVLIVERMCISVTNAGLFIIVIIVDLFIFLLLLSVLCVGTTYPCIYFREWKHKNMKIHIYIIIIWLNSFRFSFFTQIIDNFIGFDTY